MRLSETPRGRPSRCAVRSCCSVDTRAYPARSSFILPQWTPRRLPSTVPHQGRLLRAPHDRRPLHAPHDRRPLHAPHDRRPLHAPHDRRPLHAPHDRRPLHARRSGLTSKAGAPFDATAANLPPTNGSRPGSDHPDPAAAPFIPSRYLAVDDLAQLGQERQERDKPFPRAFLDPHRRRVAAVVGPGSLADRRQSRRAVVQGTKEAPRHGAARRSRGQHDAGQDLHPHRCDPEVTRQTAQAAPSSTGRCPSGSRSVTVVT
jgi:hypothetical protein